MKTMRWLTAAACFAYALPAIAQDVERIEGEQVQKIGAILVQEASKLKDAPLAVMPNAEKGLGLKAGERGGIVVPDSRLTVDAIKKADRDVVPVGLFFFHRAVLVVGDKALPREKLATFEVGEKDKKTVSVQYLGVTRVAGQLALVVFAKDKAPAVVTTLVDVDDPKDLPLDFAARKAGDDQAQVVLTVLGKYRATFLVAVAD